LSLNSFDDYSCSFFVFVNDEKQNELMGGRK